MNARPILSLVVLAWENLPLTRACITSLRSGTSGEYELIIVDNGSTEPAPRYAREASDVPVLLTHNLGFAAGMNAGLEAASGDIVAFINNDTVFPPAWNASLLEHFEDPSVGIVLPAVTAAGNPISVRCEPGTDVERLLPFGELPSGVVFLLRRSDMAALGGWNESYPVASSEDLDLCFTVWANGLDIVLDTRVLVEHVSQATVSRIPYRGRLYAENLDRFLERWGSETNTVPMLPGVSSDAVALNIGRGRTAVRWIERMLAARREAARLRQELEDSRERPRSLLDIVRHRRPR